MSGGGLYDGVHFDSPIVSSVIPYSAVAPINKYEKPTRVIAKTDEENVRKYLEKRRRQKQQSDSWV
jgi:hypothetical protein